MRIRFIFGSLMALASISLAPCTAAHEVAFADDKEIDDLATNVDKAIQACGLHAAAFNRTGGRILLERGITLDGDAPSPIKQLASLSTFGKSQFHHWPDPHAQVWLIASSEKPSCRLAISGSQWVDRIGAKLDELVRVGNFWRPLSDQHGIVPQPGNGFVYIMETPASVPIQPTLLVMTAGAARRLPSDQQMIITVMMVAKR